MTMTKADTGVVHWPGRIGRLLDLDLVGRLADLDLMGERWMRIEEVADDDGVLIRAELPGLDPERDIEVSVEQGILHIAAHREQRAEQTSHGVHRSEFHYGELSRDLALPEGAEAGEVSADYRDGILEVRVPCATPAPHGATKVPVGHG
jgi:HSP20 family protein